MTFSVPPWIVRLRSDHISMLYGSWVNFKIRNSYRNWTNWHGSTMKKSKMLLETVRHSIG